MILDSRIKEGKRPLTCFDVEIAKQFIGKKGYFSHYIDNYADLKNTALGTLGSTGDTYHESFCCTEETNDNYYYEFFIPAEWAEQKSEINFEVYDLVTFENEFNVGDVVMFKGKTNTDRSGSYYKCVYSGYRFFAEKGSTNLIVNLGLWGFTFKELFELYEIYRDNTWEPFGRKVETIDLNAINEG